MITCFSTPTDTLPKIGVKQHRKRSPYRKNGLRNNFSFSVSGGTAPPAGQTSTYQHRETAETKRDIRTSNTPAIPKKETAAIKPRLVRQVHQIEKGSASIEALPCSLKPESIFGRPGVSRFANPGRIHRPDRLPST